MKVIFVSYGRFDCNSGGHVHRFAAGLAARGCAVAVFAEGEAPAGAPYACGARQRLAGSPARALAFDGRPPSPHDTVVHAWTPREAVRVPAEALRAAGGARLVVHLEDDETLLTSAHLDRDWDALCALDPATLDALIAPSLSHPLRMERFLQGVDGVTAIVPPLFALAPGDGPRHVLAPGADLGEAGGPLRPEQRGALLRSLGVAAGHRVIVYPGNLHAANRREMFSLYVAVHILRRRGWGVTLLRTGDDYGPGLDVAFQHLRGEVSRELGRLPRPEMLSLLKLADVLVQPGAPNALNQRRLPSKLPEFLASGRPVVLPRANLGLQLRDGHEAVMLDEGHGLEIASKVEALFREPARAEAIGAAGRAFAARNLCWARATAGLEGFYADLLARPPRGRPVLELAA